MDKRQEIPKDMRKKVLEVFERFVLVDLEQDTYEYFFRGEDNEIPGLAAKGVYRDLIRELYSGVYPVGDESATMEEYMQPGSIRRLMVPGRDLLQWEYVESGQGHKTLSVLSLKRTDHISVRLLLLFQRTDGLLGAAQPISDKENSLDMSGKLSAGVRAHAEDAEKLMDSLQHLRADGCRFQELMDERKAEEPAAEARAGNVPEGLKQAKYTGKHVLLVEDNMLSRELAEELLQMTGVTVETAINGKEAVSQVAGTPEGYYDLILMDEHLPLMDGRDAARAIRALCREKARQIPIVGMTSDAGAESFPIAGETEIQVHLTKPIEPLRLAKVLEQFLT